MQGSVYILELGEHRRETFLLKQKLILELQLAQFPLVRGPFVLIVYCDGVDQLPLRRDRFEESIFLPQLLFVALFTHRM